ncbi:DUF4127 family protein [Pseudalkalibacillus salsuginis]|uniref:DUF4127 family protein n=1 Tax=Pseudalkalibacillus salsuginis TaxID=2910972 RepID=UPI001F2A0A2D|nr:DUF4127 family protein [Pseudalkalibacillus salsuginis]MCF6411566.1 DUF4127 family protein [Pseudalkalibacillus salsuginis]
MKRKIALLPVDGRPVTRDLPRQLAAIGGWEVLVPERNELGFLKEPGSLDSLQDWLKETADKVDGIVVSIDMLGYGGLVPSRISEATVEQVRERIQVLKDLKEAKPELKIMGFSATMRLSDSYVNEEEKEYWNRYGKEIWQFSYHTHCHSKTKDPISMKRVEELRLKIPDVILRDYQNTRDRNFSINRSLLDDVEEGLFDILVFPQDDTAEYGMNIQEQEWLSEEVSKRRLFEKVFIYPGADEVASTLVARMIYELENVVKPIYQPFFSGQKGALTPARYEDRPIYESVKGQVYAFGSFTVETPSEADILLAVNVPGKKQGDLALQMDLAEVDTNDRNLGEWMLRIKHYLGEGKDVAVADLAYANGSDPALMPRLLESGFFGMLSGYAGWNTAGNSLGTVIAHSAMVHLHKRKGFLLESEFKKRHMGVLIHRFLDDYLYQSVVRQTVREQVDEAGVDEQELLEVVRRQFMKALEEMPQWGEYKLNIQNIDLPWNRTFEIGLSICLERD